VTHIFNCRVYYEDTDMAGIVYYANYLKFIERGRSTLVREAGIDQMNLKQNGYVFAVRNLTAEYHSPAQLDDMLRVETKLASVSGAKIIFDQRVYRDDLQLFSSVVTVAFMDEKGRPTRLTPEITLKLQQFAA
jgi:acyl-CoA thioester hydrolase